MAPPPSDGARGRPTARVLALLEILQSGGLHTVADLASRLAVDERTVRRYAVHLSDLDIPVQSVRGRYGGYRLGPGYRLPPLMLTDDEAVGVLLGLMLGVPSRPQTAPSAAVESAVAKLRRVLPDGLAQRLDAAVETIDVTPSVPPVPSVPPAASVPTAGKPSPGTPGNAAVLLVVGAARDRHPLVFDYLTRGGDRSERTLHPYGVVAHAGRWYVTGADSVSGEIRTFRLDRMQHPAVRAGTFSVPDGFDPAEHVLAGIRAASWRHCVRLRVHGSVDEVLATPLGRLAVIDRGRLAYGWVRVRFGAERLDWVPGLLAQLPVPFVVEEPEELRAALRALGTRLTAAAS